MTKHRRMMAAIALATLAAVALTGCLVTKKQPEPPYYREPGDTLRIHEPGHWIRYNVEKWPPRSSTPQYGTLKIVWKGSSDIPGPDGKTHPVIEKHYLLCMEGTLCEPRETILIQYVHQDITGTELFVAMNDPAVTGQYFWINANGSALQGGDGLPEPAIILKSPLQSETYDSITTYLMDNCINASPCTSDLAQITSQFRVFDEGIEINTLIDLFANPFRIQYGSQYGLTNSSVVPLNNSLSLPTPVNLFSICSMENTNYTSISYSGEMYVVPEIGMIRMENHCQVLGGSGGGEVTTYIFNIDSLNFSYPT